MATSRSGGGWAPPAQPVAAGFSTVFPAVENPLSQGGIWQRGLQEGLNWTDPKVTANGCVASTTPTPNRYDDDIAHLKASAYPFTGNQYAQGTVYCSAGYTGGGGSHEIELLLRFSITANNAAGYEILWGHGPSVAYCALVRWNGPEGNYTALWDPASAVGSYTNAPPTYQNGDVFRVEITGTTATIYINGVVIGVVTGLTDYATGQPGLGFWPVDGATPANLGFKSWQAGNL
jgi:hypothetical protein